MPAYKRPEFVDRPAWQSRYNGGYVTERREIEHVILTRGHQLAATYWLPNDAETVLRFDDLRVDDVPVFISTMEVLPGQSVVVLHSCTRDPTRANRQGLSIHYPLGDVAVGGYTYPLDVKLTLPVGLMEVFELVEGQSGPGTTDPLPPENMYCSTAPRPPYPYGIGLVTLVGAPAAVVAH